jgi:hypothetical protein
MSGVRVQVSGVGFQVSGFRCQVSGFRVQDWFIESIVAFFSLNDIIFPNISDMIIDNHCEFVCKTDFYELIQ